MFPFARNFTAMHEAWHVHGHTDSLTVEGLTNRFLLGNVSFS